MLSFIGCTYLIFATQTSQLKLVQTHETYDHMSLEVKNIIDNNRATNPEYKYKFYDAVERSQYFEKNCPEYFSSYEAVIPGSYKSDLFRYCFLYTEGGIYMDDKISVLTPFKEWVTDGIIFFKCAGPDNGMITGLIHSPLPKHPIFKIALDLSHSRISKREYGIGILDVTGPYILNRAINTYLGRDEKARIKVGMYKDINIIGEERLISGIHYLVIDDKKVVQVRPSNFKQTGIHYITSYYDRSIYVTS